MENEEWSLGTATATAIRRGEGLTVTLRGVVTAQAYEALHIRLGQSRWRRCVLVIGDDALLVATAQSLADAAGRGTPANQAKPTHPVIICVRPWRLEWAYLHCAMLTAAGLCRAVCLATEVASTGA